MAGSRLAGLVVALGVLGGISACGSGSESGGSAPMMAEAAPAPAQDRGGNSATQKDATQKGAGVAAAGKPTPGQEAPQVKNDPINAPGQDRKLVRTAEVDILATDVGKAVADVRKETSVLGGYSGNAQVSTGYAVITLHVPSDKLDKLLSWLPQLGKIRSENQTAQDVTEQLVDVESRILTQRASLERVRALLARAATVSEIVSIESEVTRREADLESLLKRKENLAGSVALSEVTLRLRTDGSPAEEPTKDEDGFGESLSDGWNALVDAVGFVLRVVGAVLPFAVVLGIPAFFGFRAYRRAKAKREAAVMAGFQRVPAEQAPTQVPAQPAPAHQTPAHQTPVTPVDVPPAPPATT